MSIKALQDYTYYAKYARYNKKEKRRETWGEAVDRVLDMHLKRYPQVAEEIEWIRPLMKERRFLGSQRALQFGGLPIEKKHARIYNCAASYCDRIRFFQEFLWMLLCGTGVGFSVQKHHIEKLPKFYKDNNKKGIKIFSIPDTIEGWSDSLGVLLATYMPHQDYLEWKDFTVEYDTSLVRPAGSPLSSGVGKAPGPEPLIKALEKIRKLLDRCIESDLDALRPIDAYDICMHASDAVLSGGVRRSATLALFSPDDEEMAKAKTGNWMYENPQRARSNNSALLLRGSTSKDDFMKLISYVKEFGEPGFIWADDVNALFNPCVEVNLYAYDEDGNSGFQMCNLCEINGKKIKCKEDFAIAVRGAAILGTLQAGYTDFKYLGEVSKKIVEKEALLGISITGMMDNPDVIFDEEIQKEMAQLALKTNEWMAKKIGINPAARTTCIKPSGCRPINALTTTSEGILTLGEIMENHDIRNEWCDFQGDTSTHGGAITKTFVNGEKDVVKIRLKYGVELVCTPNHPWFVKYRIDRRKKSNRVDVNNWVQAQDLQFGDVLDIDLTAYRNEKHALLKKEYRLRAYDKHLYNCNDIIQPDAMNNDLSWLLGYLWGDGCMKFSQYRLHFIDEYRQHLEKVQRIVKEQFNIDSKLDKCNNRDAYTLEFGNKFLWYWLLRNDIYKYEGKTINHIPRIVRESSYDDILSFIAGMVDSDGHARYQVVKGGEKRYAIIFSTANEKFADHFQQVAMSVGLGFSRSLNCEGKNLQKEKRMWLLDLSAHVNQESFNILSKNSEKISSLPSDYRWKHEVMSSNVGIFGKVHSVEPIGIQPTFDIETEQSWFYAGAIKSHNTTSCILGSSSGVHPHHAKRYFRRVQGNVLEPVLQFFKEYNSFAVEKSVWAANKTDEVITFCVEVPPGAKTKNQVPAIELLEHVKSTQQNWVLYGKRKNRCMQPWLTHNVSNTINVKPEEWEEVADYIFKNRKWFAGISLIPQSGDLDYPQAPFVTVHDPREILQMYGDGSLLASGLIVDGLTCFDNDLWKACDIAMGLGEPIEYPQKPGNGCINIDEYREWENQVEIMDCRKDWVRRVEQFSQRYCGGDVRKCCYLMKEVNNWKLYVDLKREYKNVPYESFHEEEDNTKPSELIACAGGACEVSF
jgi:hypothetical protein